MAAIQYGMECTPGGQMTPLGPIPEPTHTGCPGGYSRPGLIGGWICPCDCHLVTRSRTDRQPPNTSTHAKGGSSAVAPETTKRPDLVTDNEGT